MLITVVVFNIFVETVILIQDSLMIDSSKEHLFEIEIIVILSMSLLSLLFDLMHPCE